jgi:uncharacterized protein
MQLPPLVRILVTLPFLAFAGLGVAQVAPSAEERSHYAGLFAAAIAGDVGEIERLVDSGQPVDARDVHGRTPLHVATYARRHDAMRALVRAGANANALDRDRYDIVTIAAVADDVSTFDTALVLGASGRTPLELARSRGFGRMADILRKAGAR